MEDHCGKSRASQELAVLLMPDGENDQSGKKKYQIDASMATVSRGITRSLQESGNGGGEQPDKQGARQIGESSGTLPEGIRIPVDPGPRANRLRVADEMNSQARRRGGTFRRFAPAVRAVSLHFHCMDLRARFSPRSEASSTSPKPACALVIFEVPTAAGSDQAHKNQRE